MYAIYGIIYQKYTPNVSIHTIHGSYGICINQFQDRKDPSASLGTEFGQDSATLVNIKIN